MKDLVQKNHRFVFYGSWFLLAFMQAAFTDLQDDEAYYWVYSRYLDWGYFDHPPMIALMIKAGYSLFQTELDVRLLAVILNTATLVIIEHLINRKNPFLFYAIALSLGAWQLSGFMAVPDAPLIFFTALFFLQYQRFLARTNFRNTLLLGVIAACLLYSKYHGGLVILFVLLSNPKLFTRWQVWLAGLIALLCFVPHLVWQYEHDWVSFRYHLFESNVNPYKINYTLDYLAGQLLLAGPLAGILLLPGAFVSRPKNKLDRALWFTLVGIYGFFLLSTFKGKVEANWTSPAIVPLIALGYRFLSENIKWENLLYKLAMVTLVFVVVFRLAMVVDFIPLNDVRERFHSWKSWPQEMRFKTAGSPVVFNNSYQRASKYWFETGQLTYSLNWYRERRNNYNFWPIEDSLLGKPVYMLDIYNHHEYTDSMQTGIGMLAWKYIPEFVSLAKVNILVAEERIRIQHGSPVVLHCMAEMPAAYRTYLQSRPETQVELMIAVFSGSKWIEDLPVETTLAELIDPAGFLINIPSQIPKGEYYFRMVLKAGESSGTHNSRKVKLEVE